VIALPWDLNKLRIYYLVGDWVGDCGSKDLKIDKLSQLGTQLESEIDETLGLSRVERDMLRESRSPGLFVNSVFIHPLDEDATSHFPLNSLFN